MATSREPSRLSIRVTIYNVSFPSGYSLTPGFLAAVSMLACRVLSECDLSVAGERYAAIQLFVIIIFFFFCFASENKTVLKNA